MKQRPVNNTDQLHKAAMDLLALEGHLPIVITVTQGNRTRSTAQNAMYWSELDHFRQQIQQAADEVAKHTGYTQLEVKRLIAQEMEPEQVAILFARTSEVIHEILKEVVGIPTSTRLGTKEFSRYTERLTQVMTEILGIVRAFTQRARR